VGVDAVTWLGELGGGDWVVLHPATASNATAAAPANFHERAVILTSVEIYL
jgi:hypothetical protein